MDRSGAGAMEALERARLHAGLTVAEMAARLRPTIGLSPSPPSKAGSAYWYHWRRNPRAIPAAALFAAAELAGVPLEDLLQREDGGRGMTPGRRAGHDEVASLRAEVAEIREALAASGDPIEASDRLARVDRSKAGADSLETPSNVTRRAPAMVDHVVATNSSAAAPDPLMGAVGEILEIVLSLQGAVLELAEDSKAEMAPAIEVQRTRLEDLRDRVESLR